MADDPQTTAETPEDFGTSPAATAQRWVSEINLAEKAQQPWVTRSRRIIERYADSGKGSDTRQDARGRRFALLWSNIQTLQPATLARKPEAVVSRRWKDEDPIGRVAATVLERALNFSLDAFDIEDVLTGVRDEFLLVGRGQGWVRYVPHMQTVEPGGDREQGSDGQVADDPYEVVAWEEAVCDHVSWDDFLHNPARKWGEVRWVGRRVFMTRDELVARFPACGKEVPLDHEPADYAGPEDQKDQFRKAQVYEIWDKPSRKAIWISKGYTTGPLDERADPLQLQEFFPCPRPPLGTRPPDSLIPTPDFVFYQSQARDIDALTARIGKLTEALKLKGFYAAGDQVGKDLDSLLSKDTGTLIPVDSWAAFAEKGGVKGLIEWIPLDMVVLTLKGCIEARKQLIDDVYQLTGIADIMRGDTDPDETAAAQKIKANWGSSRIRDRQKELARFARDLLRIQGQVIASKFSPETLAAMTNVQLCKDQAERQALQAQAQAMAQAQQQPPPEVIAKLMAPATWQDVVALLKDNTLRAFRIDIETDSTIEPNDQEEKQRRIEFIEAIAKYVSQALPAITTAPQLLPVIIEGLKFLVRGFRVGREMEEVIDRAMDELSAAGGMQPPPQKGPQQNPAVDQAKAQAAQMGAQADIMQAQAAQGHLQVEAAKVQSQHQIGMGQIQAENARTAADRAAELHMHGQSLQADMHDAVIKAEERQLTRNINSTAPMEAPTK